MISPITIGYDAVAFLGVLVVMFVMQKTEHDKINRLAPPPLREIRRLFFVVTSLLLLFSIWEEASYRSLMILVVSGLMNFLINAIALYLRTPPDDGDREEIQRGYPSMGHYISRSDVLSLDRGQKYTHELLEAILRNQELDPKSAVDATVVVPVDFRAKK